MIEIGDVLFCTKCSSSLQVTKFHIEENGNVNLKDALSHCCNSHMLKLVKEIEICT
jgi:hypothetical protein